MISNIYYNEDVAELEENGDLNPEAAGFMLGFNDAIPAEI